MNSRKKERKKEKRKKERVIVRMVMYFLKSESGKDAMVEDVRTYASVGHKMLG